ncbi:MULTISPECIES: sensor histidine kinase [Romboutsia]|uniref:histidine kinase n=1 Tax=Romboutsia hominis TaxID=1507512 RepID=A0A2P2BTG6_9FIRM|nr:MULTISPECIES: PAS domain-containing sensor histidine kinase [Romboutsia]MDB8804494.1 PAS domain-containing sensor histidine kinase [Romboutsia sp. 1001216sp1]MDB8806582.1 PAS domain-containing sensor histidine kinase [Romboutsia sp. 1001216sp1]MDB8810142.1 PAS domain-containing sensor histidine kinase [Romboutsia sp. 1001216sp1]MDB8815889.1 PAS domain-containing sensor histidine kinase [Romboutsia sp. 1001216sp1]MDB8818339.1 PAS domain-containing sensor histidine kinase [Romboutsia sp. 1001
MHKYINILTVSILLAMLYVVYSKYILHKSKKDIIVLSMIVVIIISKAKDISQGSLSNFYMIAQVLILISVCENNINKKINNLIFISFILLLTTLIDNKIGLYNILVTGFISTMIFYEIIKLTRRKSISKITVIFITFIYSSILLSLLVEKENVLLYRSIIDIIVYLYMFKNIVNSYIIIEHNRVWKKKKMFKKGNKNISLYNKKLEQNKYITAKLEKNLENKKELIKEIVGEEDRCIFIIDSNGCILSKDDNFLRIWNKYKVHKEKLTIDEFLRDNIKDKLNFINSIEKTKKHSTEIKSDIKSKDGRFFKVTFTPIKFNKNESIICSFKDITYNKQNEIKTDENNIKYEKIIETIPYNILITDNNNILYNSKDNGIDFNEKEIKRIVLEDSITGEICYSSMGKNSYMNIDRTSFKDGDTHKNLVVIKDITEYKESIEKLKLSKEKYKTFVNIIPEGIYLADYRQKNIIYKNVAFTEISRNLNLEEEDILLNNDILISSNKNNEEVVFKRKDVLTCKGEELNLEVGKKLIEINNEIKEIGIVRDITESVNIENIEREIEAKKIANKIKTEFFVNMSHELKTPLNVISSSIQLIEYIYKDKIEKEISKELNNSISIIKKNSYMLMNLINNVIDLAKLESEFHETNVNCYNIVTLIEETCEEFNKYLLENDINIVFDTSEEEIVSRVDDDDIERVILTLLSIVIRYSCSNSTIYVDLDRKGNKTNISIRNKDKYNHYKYINDKYKSAIDIGFKVTENILELYNGDISVNRNNRNGIEINLNIESDLDICEYKERGSKKSENFIYTEYLRMCNF